MKGNDGMVTRILKQVKVLDIYAMGDTCMGHGYCDHIAGLTWVDSQVWESEEICNKLLEDAIADWRKRREENTWGTTSHKPELYVYWKTIEEIKN